MNKKFRIFTKKEKKKKKNKFLKISFDKADAILQDVFIAETIV